MSSYIEQFVFMVRDPDTKEVFEKHSKCLTEPTWDMVVDEFLKFMEKYLGYSIVDSVDYSRAAHLNLRGFLANVNEELEDDEDEDDEEDDEGDYEPWSYEEDDEDDYKPWSPPTNSSMMMGTEDDHK